MSTSFENACSCKSIRDSSLHPKHCNIVHTRQARAYSRFQSHTVRPRLTDPGVGADERIIMMLAGRDLADSDKAGTIPYPHTGHGASSRRTKHSANTCRAMLQGT